MAELSKSEIGLLLHEGNKGFTMNASRKGLEQTVENWKDQSREEELKKLIETFGGAKRLMDFVAPTTEHKSGERTISTPNMLEGVEAVTGTNKAIITAKKFAEDYLDNYCKYIRQVQEESSLTKKQFLVYLLRKKTHREQTVANLMSIEVGTVRSHMDRARKKIEKAEKTVEITDMFHIGEHNKFQQKHLEPLKRI